MPTDVLGGAAGLLDWMSLRDMRSAERRPEMGLVGRARLEDCQLRTAGELDSKRNWRYHSIVLAGLVKEAGGDSCSAGSLAPASPGKTKLFLPWARNTGGRLFLWQNSQDGRRLMHFVAVIGRLLRALKSLASAILEGARGSCRNVSSVVARVLGSLVSVTPDVFPPYRTIKGRLASKEADCEGRFFIYVDDEKVEVDWPAFDALDTGENLRVRSTRSRRAINIDRLLP